MSRDDLFAECDEANLNELNVEYEDQSPLDESNENPYLLTPDEGLRLHLLNMASAVFMEDTKLKEVMHHRDIVELAGRMENFIRNGPEMQKTGTHPASMRIL